MKPRNKYGARKVVVDGHKFDSLREANRWGFLQALQRLNKISQLERQVTFVLAPGVKFKGEKRAKPALRYVADFRYFNPDKAVVVVEDAKGRQTEAFRIKRHLMKSVHNIDVVLS